MKKRLQYLIFALFLALVPAFSQAQGKDKLEQLKAAKVAYITQRAGLTSEESAKFWPVYNKFDTERTALKRQMRKIMKDIELNSDTYSDQEIEKLMRAVVDLKQKEVELEKRYFEEFKKLIPMKKVALVFIAEREFYQKVLKLKTDD